MKVLDELYLVIKTQKSIRVGRLAELIGKLVKELHYKDIKIEKQQKTIEHLNKGHNHQKTRADRLQKKLDKLQSNIKEAQ